MLRHLTDHDVQQYVDDLEQCNKVTVQHVHVCEECRMKVEVYQVLIKGIRQQPQPSFGFDLSKLVLQQLPAPQPKASTDKWVTWIFIFIGIGLITGTSIYFSEYFSALFKNFDITILVYLAIVTAVAVIGALFIDMYKRYNREMKLLDTY